MFDARQKKSEVELIKFDSRSELALGVLLEKYIPGFELKNGVTCQVPLGDDRHCDFRLNEKVFIEYHPIELVREYDKSFLIKVHKEINKQPKNIAEKMKKALREQAAKEYYERRLYLVQWKYGTDRQLIHARNPEDAFTKIFNRYAKGAVGRERFLEEFRAAQSAEPLHLLSRKKFFFKG